jgi:predicted nucleic acid-binding protein
MVSNLTKIYWDADVIISYVNDNPERIPILEAILEATSKDDSKTIVTSTISKVEVCWTAIEKNNRALSDVEVRKIDDLFEDYSVMTAVEFNDEIALLARKLMRDGMSRGGKKLATNDAIHLASAEWAGAQELNTYNLKHYRYFENLTNLVIREPKANQPKLL